MVKFLFAILREALSKQCFERTPEAYAIMSAVENVNDFDAEGNSDGAMAVPHLFISSHVSKTVSGCKRVLDLGCGSGQLLCQVAEINPEIHFTGVDLSEEMLNKAKKRAKSMNLSNVEFIKQDFTQLQDFADRQFDGVMCVNALHHLNDLQSLRNFFRTVNSYVKQDTPIFIYDFCRLRSEKSIDFFVDFVGVKQALCREDFRNSLKAAFSLDEFKTIIDEELHREVNIYTTRLMHIYLMIKTEERSISAEKIGKLEQKLFLLSLKNQMSYKNICKKFYKIN
ncbi:class I SAM-dependent methyltransferase [Pseudobacteroides cellulosolvens]|uniref:Methyltransferase domain-containing protein n=1 Tax=Pseudobacteroides cellulosolvens ATCC 35603 = DSM 2933 TaxID=398512 RepID=A0A0L6JM45_9FIRM|nr:class I SAM-dependent methyltransferase [Pseudobacteroides cellulosolvens]KNY26871.1 hypothetical protein Bccel_2136 [Pseudobacteroides cellulosolvens ATCC 35603 = DSM 2933]